MLPQEERCEMAIKKKATKKIVDGNVVDAQGEPLVNGRVTREQTARWAESLYPKHVRAASELSRSLLKDVDPSDARRLSGHIRWMVAQGAAERMSAGKEERRKASRERTEKAFAKAKEKFEKLQARLAE